MDKYKNKYRIPSARLQNWDYRWAGAYFITICTQNREHYFGEIKTVKTGNALSENKIQLSKIGVIADILWHEIKNHAPNVELGEFTVMPNHIHGILVLNNNGADMVDNNVDGAGANTVETGHALSLQSQQLQQLQQHKTIGQKRFQNIGKNSISSIVGSYKSAVSRHAHRLGFGFEWQTRFYDHIIRNDKSYQTIKQYIINNPSKWTDDKFYNE